MEIRYACALFPYIRREHSKWPLGGEIESVWADENHFIFGVGVKYEPDFSLHFEVVYDLFTWQQFHLGLAIDYSWAKDDAHFALGIHVAYCF